MARSGRIAVAAAAVLLQCVALYAPRAASPDVGAFPLDKVVHIGLFAFATAALLWAGVGLRAVLIAMGGQAVVSELVQALVLPQRSGDVWDLVADILGILLGVAAAAALGQVRVRRVDAAAAPERARSVTGP